MVSVNTLHYEFEIMNHRLHSGDTLDISSVDIDSFLNNAKDIILRNYNRIVEKNRYIENDLRVLEVMDKELTKVRSTSEYDSYELPNDYYDKLNVRCKATCELCNEPQDLKTISYTSFNNLNESLKDPFRKPSWNFRRTLYNIVDNNVILYHCNILSLKEVSLSYIKYIPNVYNVDAAQGNILDSDGVTVIKENKHLLLPSNGTLWRKIVEIAVYLYKKSTDDNYKIELDSIMFNQSYGVN